jgi:TolA-binding protein
MAPEELIPMILLGIGKTHFDREEFEQAIASLDGLLKDYSQSDSSPEAIFFQGVSLYKSTHDAQPLKEVYEKLQSEYPSSEWTKRAAPYRLL